MLWGPVFLDLSCSKHLHFAMRTMSKLQQYTAGAALAAEDGHVCADKEAIIAFNEPPCDTEQTAVAFGGYSLLLASA